jgi:adenine/guanine phosphoribosyltransferase-like PRPP-binding protein
MNELPHYDARWHAPVVATPSAQDDFDTHYPVRLTDGSVLELPLRALPGGEQAIALLMSNQTPFAVEDALLPLLVRQARKLAPQTIVGVPTMGLDYARRVARELDHPHYAALGLSRKFWYDEELSERLFSSTSPDQKKSIYLDPALMSRVKDQRVLLVDDVINTGVSAGAAIRLLQRAGAQVEGLLVLLTEGQAWRDELRKLGADWPGRVQAIGHIPTFLRTAQGRWRPDPRTL